MGNLNDSTNEGWRIIGCLRCESASALVGLLLNVAPLNAERGVCVRLPSEEDLGLTCHDARHL